MNIHGFDLSLTNSGHATFALNTQEGAFTLTGAEVVKSKAAKIGFPSLERFERIADDLVQGVEEGDFAAIEGFSMQSQYGRPHNLGGLSYLVLQRLAQAGVRELCIVPPSTLKLYATGNGAATKEAMIAYANRAFPGLSTTNDNIADAAWLGAVGTRLVSMPVDIGHARTQEALAKVERSTRLK